MATHQKVHKLGGTFFCMFTCFNWLPLFATTNSYDLVYDWMKIAQQRVVEIHGYVIMPNHVHVLLSTPPEVDLNKLFSNGKRFMAYSIIERLRNAKEDKMLLKLEQGIRESDSNRAQRHRVFRTSTDIRECNVNGMAEQKLDYIHSNPVSGKWNLVQVAQDYAHSSAGFYHGIENEFISLVHLNLATQGRQKADPE